MFLPSFDHAEPDARWLSIVSATLRKLCNVPSTPASKFTPPMMACATGMAYVRTMYDNASWRARAHDRVYDDLLAMWSYDEDSVMPRYRLRHFQLLNPKHYRQARDPADGRRNAI